jgi:hypothetical protein
MRSVRPTALRFAVLFAATAVGLTAAGGLLNGVVDPYGIFGAPLVRGFNATKPRPDVMLDEIKAIVGARVEPQVLILGNSRAEIGFDPQHPALVARGGRGFNASVPGSGTDYALEAFRWFGERADPTLTIVGIDFLDFPYAEGAGATPPAAPPSSTPMALLKARLLALFSATALQDSIRTLLIQHQANPATLRPDGFNPLLDYRAIAANEGYGVLFRQRAEQAARSLAAQPHALVGPRSGTSPSLIELDALIALAAREGSELKLAIYPFHLLLMLQIEQAGLWPLYEAWKVDIARRVEAGRREGAHVALWDFGCPGPLTAEAVPLEGDRQGAMHWYWEAGHFKKELGDVMLSTMLAPGATPDVSAFGVELTPANVEARNAHCREALATMATRDPRLSSMAAGLAAQARALRARS